MSFKAFKSNENEAVVIVSDTKKIRARVTVFGSSVNVPTEMPIAEKVEGSTTTLASLRAKANNGKK